MGREREERERDTLSLEQYPSLPSVLSFAREPYQCSEAFWLISRLCCKDGFITILSFTLRVNQEKKRNFSKSTI